MKIHLITHFPPAHPRAGKETFFREMFFNSLLIQGRINDQMYNRYRREFNLNKNLMPVMPEIPDDKRTGLAPAIEFYKDHTLVPGESDIKSGDLVDVVFDHDGEITLLSGLNISHTQKLEVIREDKKFGVYVDDAAMHPHQTEEIAWNEGMSRREFFQLIGYPKSFSGTIICWNPSTWYGENV